MITKKTFEELRKKYYNKKISIDDLIELGVGKIKCNVIYSEVSKEEIRCIQREMDPNIVFCDRIVSPDTIYDTFAFYNIPCTFAIK